MNKTYDVIIIGAGILGCFAARNLARFNLRVLVLEKNNDVCTGITRANTGIIYQGYDQHPGSIKADMCKAASEYFPTLCKELDVEYRKTGLMMVSFGPKGNRTVEKKLQHGLEAGIKGLSIIDADEIRQLEPNITGEFQQALYSEDTYTVNPWELGIAAFENAKENGVTFLFGQEVTEIVKTGGLDGQDAADKIKVSSNNGQADSNGEEELIYTVKTTNGQFKTLRIICCAGISNDHIWEMVNEPKVRLVPQDADYIIMDSRIGDEISHVISIEPEEYGEGLTLVPTVGNNIMIGPTRRDNKGEVDYSTDKTELELLLKKAGALAKGITPEYIIRCFGATRPNPYEVIKTDQGYELSKKSINDFAILKEDGMLSLIGVKTPGITCSNELGKYAAKWAVESLGREADINESFSPVRKSISKPDKGEIICRCKNITRQEVVEAIKRGAVSVNGVKRRTGAGMGRCQGGVCTEKIMNILAAELGVDIKNINREGTGTEILE